MFYKPMLITIFLPVFAFAMGQDRGGGNDVGLEFATYARTALQDIRIHSIDGISTDELTRLLQTIDQMKVITVSSKLNVPVLDIEQSVVAVNFPASLTIEIDEAKWRAISDDRVRGALSLHEIASLIGLESTGDYHISSRYLIAAGYTKPLDTGMSRTHEEPSGNPPMIPLGRVFVKNLADACGLVLEGIPDSSDILSRDVAYEGQGCAKALPMRLEAVSSDTYAKTESARLADQLNVKDCDLMNPGDECKLYPYMYDASNGKYLGQKGDEIFVSNGFKIIDSSHLIWLSEAKLMRGSQVLNSRIRKQYYALSQHHIEPYTPDASDVKQPAAKKQQRAAPKTSKKAVRKVASRPSSAPRTTTRTAIIYQPEIRYNDPYSPYCVAGCAGSRNSLSR